MRLWDTETWELKHTLIGSVGAADTVAFSADARTLATGHYHGTVLLWDTETGEHKRMFDGHTYSVNSLAFNPEGTVLASVVGDATIFLWKID